MMYLSKKLVAAGMAAALTVSLSSACLAAAAEAKLEVKDFKANTGSVKIETPYISGAKGGAAVDKAVNETLASNTIGSLYSVLPNIESDGTKLRADFDKTFKGPDAIKQSQYFIKQVTEYVDHRLKLDAEKADTASKGQWYLTTDYTVKMATPDLLSLVQNTYSYTGGAHDVSDIKTVNYDLKTGKELSLEDLFMPGSDYKSRLNMLIDIQEKGDKRIYEKVSGKTLAEKKPANITGKEKFYLTKDASLVIVYNKGEIAPVTEGTQVYSISVNDYADIMRL